MTADGADDRNVARVAGNVAPLTSTERSRRHRLRKAEATARGGAGRPFAAGNLAAVRHGAFSPALTGPLAEQIAADLLTSPSCPDFLRTDPTYAAAVMGWATAEAECRRLRARRDELDQLEGPDASLIEETRATETEDRDAPGVMARESLVRQRESLARALHRAETRARSLRNDLGLSPQARVKLGKALQAPPLDLARHWAEEDSAERPAR